MVKVLILEIKCVNITFILLHLFLILNQSLAPIILLDIEQPHTEQTLGQATNSFLHGFNGL